MNLTCEYNRINQALFLGDTVRQVLIEAQLQIPEAVPKLERIKSGAFRIDPPRLVINEDLLIVKGDVYPSLLYLAASANRDDLRDEGMEIEADRLPREYRLDWAGEAGLSFEERIEIPGLNQSMMVEVELTPSAASFEPDGEEKLVFHGKIELSIQTNASQAIEVISEIHPADRISPRKEEILLEETATRVEKNLPLQASLQLPGLKPGINRILDYQLKPVNLTAQAVGNRLSLKGALEFSVIYVGNDDEGRPTDIFVNEWDRKAGNAVPFEIQFDPGNTGFDQDAKGQMILMPKVMARNVGLVLQSQRELFGRLELVGQITISRVESREVVIEVDPAPGETVDVEKCLVNFREFAGETTGEIDFATEVTLPFGLPEIERILAYRGRIDRINLEAAEEKALADGTFSLWLDYIAAGSDASRLVTAAWEPCNNNLVQIGGILEFPGLQPGAVFQSQVALEELNLELTGERVLQVRGKIKAVVVANRPRAFMALKNCALVDPIDPATRPSLLIYLVQSGDTLWKIARRYQTTVESLVKANQITSPDSLSIGQKLVIPKRLL